MAEPILRVEGLRTVLRTGEGLVRAVDGVDLEINAGEIVGVVGEFGCGKSMTAMSIMRLVPNPPGKIVGGKVLFGERDLLTLSPDAMRAVRGREIAMIFQDPTTYLNPVLTVEVQIAETLKRHLHMNHAACHKRVRELLDRVRIPDPDRVAKSYPHQLSGGMRQRIMIASALSCEPKLIIADEPTTALDVTVQAQILDLLKDIIRQSGASLMLITHDLGVVAETCERVYVMYAGKIVETSPVEALFLRTKHPYTRGLLRSVLRADERRDDFDALDGVVPNLIQEFPGCSFRDRCGEAIAACATTTPPWVVDESRAGVACWRFKP